MEDPLPAGARTELARLDVRWQQLPLDQARLRVQLVRTLAQRYADEVADSTGTAPCTLPDLGPGTIIDQLTVTAYDASRVRRSDADPARRASVEHIVDDLAGLRRDLAAPIDGLARVAPLERSSRPSPPDSTGSTGSTGECSSPQR